MERSAIADLNSWLISKDRKPLVIRGARQVGKTWLVGQLAKISGKRLIELNFEKQPQLISLFETNDVQQILLNIDSVLKETVDPQDCLLFLDEIQAAPELLSKLRWFAEDLPTLPVIAAGSLLEFVLEEHSFSMPVGRINYMHLEPISFEEFLLAKDKKNLYSYLKNYQWDNKIPEAIHMDLVLLFKEYIIIGGMPAAVSSWISERSLPKVNQIHHDLMATYRDDCAKYSGRIAIGILEEVMMAVPKLLGQKFGFSKINPSLYAATIKKALHLLNKARICHRVVSCDANGVPLAAEKNEKYFKEIFLDTGLACAVLGINFNHINTITEIILINKGSIAEQIVGQLLRTIDPLYIEPHLSYWRRDEKGSSAEIDYVIQHGNRVIPIEVKAGSTGSLKSLHLFMELKKLPVAVRINLDFPSKTTMKIKGHHTENVEYLLLSTPFYLIGQLHRLLDLATEH